MPETPKRPGEKPEDGTWQAFGPHGRTEAEAGDPRANATTPRDIEPPAHRTVPAAPENDLDDDDDDAPGDPTIPAGGSADSAEAPYSSRGEFDDVDLEPPPVIAPGQVVFGKYRLEEKIGEGGMGEVWLVHHIDVDRRSALK